MKAHIKSTQAQPMALYYGVGDDSPLVSALSDFGVEAKRIKAEDLSQPLGVLCGEGGKARAAFTGDAPDTQMLIMYAFADGEINRLLTALREAQIAVPLKAVVTKTNKTWSVTQLIEELMREKESLEGKNDGK